MTKKKWIGLGIAFVLFVTIVFIPEIKNLEERGQRCLALFVAVFVLYIFESIPAAVISLAVVPLLVILKICNVNEALCGFSSTSTYLVIGSFILAAAMLKTGLGKRITCRLLLMIGTSPVRISFGLVVVNIVMAFLIPSSTARTAMLLPICVSIIHEYNGTSEDKKKYAANILLTLCVTSSSISAGILTSTVSNPMAVEYIRNTTGGMVTYSEWFVWGFPPALLMTVVSWLVIQLLFKIKTNDNHDESGYLRFQLVQMGKMRANEKFVAFIIIITVVLWVLGGYIDIDSTTVAILGAVLMFTPRCNVLEWKDCQDNISLSVVFIISGGISLGSAMADVGTSDWLADKVFGWVPQYISLVVIVIIVVVVVQFMHIFFVGTATMANAFFPILISFAVCVNVDPMAIIMPAAFMTGGYPVLMFFNTTPNILCYDTGDVKAIDFVRTGIPISICACIVYSLCALWYWPMVGMM